MSSARILAPKAASMLASTSARAAARPALRSNLQLQLMNSQRGISGMPFLIEFQSPFPLFIESYTEALTQLSSLPRCRPHSPAHQPQRLPNHQAPKPPQDHLRLWPIHPPVQFRARQRPRRSRSTSRYRSRDHRSCRCRCRYRNGFRLLNHGRRSQPELEGTVVQLCDFGVRVCGGYGSVRAHGCVHDSLYLDEIEIARLSGIRELEERKKMEGFLCSLVYVS